MVRAVELSRRAMGTIRQNLVWAFGYNVSLIPMAVGLLFTAKLSPLGMGRAGVWSSPYIQRMIEENNAPIVRMFPGMVYGAGSWFENSVYSLGKSSGRKGDGRNAYDELPGQKC